MKRMNRGDRKFWVDHYYSKLFRNLTCEVGAWNRDKLLDEFEKKLKQERRRR